MTTQKIIAATFLLALTGVARAATCDPQFIKHDAEILRATTLCDKDFIDDRGALVIRNFSVDCREKMKRSEFLSIAKRGLVGFDTKIKEEGLARACGAVEQGLKNVDKIID